MDVNQNDIPTFNLKAVVNETGLKPDTLRAWERRYGLPQPQRTSGRHRLYSQHDIDTLKWLVCRQKEGLTISRAVDLWHQLEEEGQNPLQAMPLAQVPTSAAPTAISGDSFIALRDAWLAACLNFDEAAAENILTQAFALYPAETVCLEIIRWGIAKVGNDWHRGTVTVQQEHFTSALAMRRLETLIAASPPPTRQGRILVACPPEEEHTFSPLLLTWLLRRRGWQTLFLGANVPLDRFELTLRQTQPQLVILTAQQLHTASNLRRMGDMLNDLGVPFAYGGLIFILNPDLRNFIPGHYLNNKLEKVPEIVEQLLTSPGSTPEVPEMSAAYADALAHYMQRLPYIHTRVREILGPEVMATIPNNYLTSINMHMAQDIEAGLNLGDMNLLSTDLNWVAALLNNRNIPEYALLGYMKAYYEAVAEQTDERGAPILDWLGKMTMNGNTYDDPIIHQFVRNEI